MPETKVAGYSLHISYVKKIHFYKEFISGTKYRNTFGKKKQI